MYGLFLENDTLNAEKSQKLYILWKKRSIQKYRKIPGFKRYFFLLF